MKLNELKERLEQRNTRKDAYSLTGGAPNEAYCIKGNVGRWEVYYSERGEKVGLKIFRTEDEACDYFLDWVIKNTR